MSPTTKLTPNQCDDRNTLVTTQMNRPTTWPTWTRFALTSRDLDAAFDSLGGARSFERWRSSLRHRLLTGTGFPPLDKPKRWDEANVIELLDSAGPDVRLLDAGAYNSPAPWAASQAGVRCVDGIDLNPRVPMSPRSRKIRYSCQNMMETAYVDGAFDVIVSGSTVEHGVDWHVWLDECRRLLVEGGLLYVSTDVVHPTVDTAGLEAFGLPWTPLHPQQVADMTQVFASHGFSSAEIEPPELPDHLPVTFLGHDIGFVGFAVTAV